MQSDLTRRGFLAATGAAAAAGAMSAARAPGQQTEAAQPASGKLKILGIGCSPRQPSSTAAALEVCLQAAQEVAPDRIEVELIKLAGLQIPGCVAAGVELPPGATDDFPSLVPKLGDPAVAGMVIGSPVYFSNMSSLCKAFLERLMVFRKDNFALSNTVAGALAVGGARNGGQELTIRSIHSALFAQEMIIVGEQRPTAHFGPCVWNSKEFAQVTDDTVGMEPTRNLGRRVAQVALALAASRES